jgi:hypothetical protein
VSGYTPLFSSLTTGTLYGRWPDIGLWPIMLSLADRFGIVDVTPHYLAGVTGLTAQEIIDCMKRFCEPDPYSRSKDEKGSRLVLIDAHRDWGWRVVNHAKYREKARKAMHQAVATDTGSDAERKRVQRSPAICSESSAVRPSDSTQTHTQGRITAHPKRMSHASVVEFFEFKAAYPKRSGDQGWRKAERVAGARLREGHTWAEMTAGAQRYATYVRSTSAEGSEFVKQAASFLGPDKPFLEPWDIPPSSKGGTNGAVDETAMGIWEALVAGKPRDDRTQQALDRIGGWGRVRNRSSQDDFRVRSEFCNAWQEAGKSSFHERTTASALGGNRG